MPIIENDFKPKHHVITHCDTFHCDEVTGTAMLDYCFDGLDSILRTRDIAKITESLHNYYDNDGMYAGGNDKLYVLDVGLHYDPKKNHYDHHQESFTDTFDGKYTILLSSCGLIWKHFGKNIINKMIRERCGGDGGGDGDGDNGVVNVDEVYDKFYRTFVIAIDANDTGTSFVNKEKSGKVVFNYNNNISLSSIVSKFNADDVNNYDTQLKQFTKAKNVCKEIFTASLYKTIIQNLNYNKHKPVFEEAFNNRQNPEIMVINQKISTYLYMNDFDPDQTVKFIIMPRSKTEWQIYTVEKRGQRFKHLVSLVSQDTAKSLYGEDVVFIHRARFTGAFKSLEIASDIAEMSLEQHAAREDKKHTQTKISVSVNDRISNFLYNNKYIIGGLGLVIASVAGAVIGHRKFR